MTAPEIAQKEAQNYVVEYDTKEIFPRSPIPQNSGEEIAF
jgi:hypothetical protein